LATPWKRTFTAPQAGIALFTFLRLPAWLCGMFLVGYSNYVAYTGKVASRHTITTITDLTFIHYGTKKYKPSKLLQKNYIHSLGNIPYYFSLYFLRHISAQIKV
jgi:hypothetical protein